MGALSLTLTFDGHRVRMAGTADAPLWVAKDVCFVLGLHGASNVSRDVPEADKGIVNLTTPGGPQSYVCVKEAGLYRLIARSRKPSARRFQAWLFGEVLPSIRKHGCYPPPVALPTATALDLHDPRQLAAVALQALQLCAEYQPKAQALDRLAAAEGDVGLQECGRLLGLPPNGHVARMIEDGLLFRGSHGKPTPYAHLVERGYFRVVLTEPDGQGRTFAQSFVTPAGMAWLAVRYARDAAALAARALPPVAGGPRPPLAS